VLKESKKGAILYKSEIPMGAMRDLYRGEDYELIFTVSKNEGKIDLLKSKFYLVGRVKNKGFGYKMADDKGIHKVSVKGYTHF
jgi:thiamine monophosphate kinase